MVNTLTPAKKFEILQKHAKDFAAKKGSSRPVLEGVYFAPDGSAWVTDSHHALFIQGVHNYENPFISSVHNGAKIEGFYPDLKTIFLDGKKEAKKIAVLKRNPYDNSFGTLKKFLKAASDLTNNPKGHFTQICTDGDYLLLHTKAYNIEFKFFFDCDFTSSFSPFDPLSVYLNPDYLLHAVNVFISAESQTIGLLIKDNAIFLSDKEKGIDILIATYNRKD